jgi:YVTN family beta-propeller protein
VTHVQDRSVARIDLVAHAVTEIGTGNMPCAAAVDEDRGEVYVANYVDGSVTVIDADRGIVRGTIVVGRHPEAIAVDVAKGLVYVANTLDGSVSVIDARTRRVVKTVAAGEHPYAIAVDTRTHRVYVANLGAGVSYTMLRSL